MSRTWQPLGVLALFLIGLWGCSQSGTVTADRGKQLEGRIAKLEEDLKGTVASRDALKARFNALEEHVRAESERAKLIVKERDALTAQINAKVVEKDAAIAEKAAATAQYDDLVKKLESVLGQAKVTQAQRGDDAAGKVRGTVTSFEKK